MVKINKDYPENPQCPKCKKRMESNGTMINDTYYCKNKSCEYCGISREIFPWEK